MREPGLRAASAHSLSGTCQLAWLTSPALTGEEKVPMERYSDLFEWVRMALTMERSKT